MQTFQIVRQISGGKRRINGRAVDTMQATVRFPDGDTTRHLQHQPVFDEKGKVTGHQWTGWNSDSARRERAVERAKRVDETHPEIVAFV